MLRMGPVGPRRTLAVLIALGASASAAAGQEGCELGGLGNDIVNIQTLPGLGQVTYITRPHFVCDGGVQIFADSAIAYSDQGWSHLLGSVRYEEASRELRSDEARYFTNEGRLQAEGSLVVEDGAQGSRIEHGDLVYLLETDFRETSEMTVTTGADGVRPRALLTPPEREQAPQESVPVVDSVASDTAVAVPADSLPPPEDSLPPVEDPIAVLAPEPALPDTTPPTPYAVEGDRMLLRGEGYFTAAGTVEIERDSLFAFGDSAVYDQTAGDLLLVGTARVEGAAYRLTGRSISMATPGSAASRVHALRDARLEGDDFDLTAAQIFLFLRDDALERLVAVPIARGGALQPPADSADLVRPEAFVQDLVLTSDSLEINAPGEVLERVFAAGTARSVSTARDSLNVDDLPEVARSDWLEGDTVVIIFRPVIGTADASDVDVEAIIARVAARSLYRLPPNDSTAVAGTDPPALHYVMGDSIRIEMSEGEVAAMRVTGQTRGVHLEPLRRAPPADSTAVAADSAAASPDSARTTPDTLEAGRGSRPGAASAPRSPPRDRRDPRMETTPWIRP